MSDNTLIMLFAYIFPCMILSVAYNFKLKEVYYIPFIPIINIILLLAIFIRSIYLDIKNKKWKLIIDYIVCILISFIGFILALTTGILWWILLIIICQIYMILKYDYKKLKL